MEIDLKLMRRGSFVLMALAITSCNTVPVSVSGCSVVKANANEVAASFDLRKNVDRSLSEVRIFEASATSGYISYVTKGDLPTGIWVHRTVYKTLSADGGTWKERTGPAALCELHGVVFADGSVFNGGVPFD